MSTHGKVWCAANISTAPAEIRYPKAPPSVGEFTNVLAESWGPLEWLEVESFNAGNLNLKVWVREGVGWGDRAVDFAANINTQYTTYLFGNSTGRNAILRIVGEIHGFQIVTDTGSSGILFRGGCGMTKPF